MSAPGDVDPASIASLDDLQRAFRHLQARVDELEAELETERERRERLENLVEYRDDGREGTHVENLYLAGLPVGQILQSKAPKSDLEKLEDRVDAAFEDAVQAEIDPRTALPIMQVTRTYQSEPRSLTDTQRRAAIVWSEFFHFATTTQARHVLPSGEVKKILAAHDENTHRETRGRVMDLVAELGRQYIHVEQVNGQNALVIEREPFEAYAADLHEEVEP